MNNTGANRSVYRAASLAVRIATRKAVCWATSRVVNDAVRWTVFRAIDGVVHDAVYGASMRGPIHPGLQDFLVESRGP